MFVVFTLGFNSKMEYFQVGARFASYKILMETLEQFCQETQSKFWKRDARTISASRASGIQRFLDPEIMYYEIKYTCVYGGVDFKPKGRNIRTRNPSLKCNGCPAYMRFKASDDGNFLLLVAINLNHNHELILPVRKAKRKTVDEGVLPPKIQKTDIDDVKYEKTYEIEDSNHSNDAELQSTSEGTIEFPNLIAPVFTPFNDDETKSLNLDIIPSYAKYLVNAGVMGVVVNATTGEGMSMTVVERKRVTEAWAQVSLKLSQHLMVQVGGAALPDVLDLARHAEENGANSLLCLPELFHKPTNIDELIHYLEIVASAAPNTPLVYYHIPSVTNVNIHMGDFLNEIGTKIPTFQGIKFTSTDLYEGSLAAKAAGGKFNVFLGADMVMVGAHALGVKAAIATTINILPDHLQRILHLMNEGDLNEAQNVQDELTTLIKIITRSGTWVPTMKEVMNFLCPIVVGPVREPLKSLTPPQVKVMQDELTKLGLM